MRSNQNDFLSSICLEEDIKKLSEEYADLVNDRPHSVNNDRHTPQYNSAKFNLPRQVGGKDKTPGTSNMPRKVRKKEKTPTKYRPAKNLMSDSSYSESMIKQPVRMIPKPKVISRSKSKDRKLMKREKKRKTEKQDDIFDF